jgi:hypothetical protein
MKTRLLLTTVSALLAVGIALRMGAEMGGERAAIPAPSAVAETTQTGQPLPVQNASVEQADLSTTVLPAEAPLAHFTSASDILQRLNAETQWSQRSAVAKELRSLSDPGELSVLLPALMENYGRGNTIFNEISDAIARLAQAETVEMLEFMHWEASTQAGQGRKILRTIAGQQYGKPRAGRLRSGSPQSHGRRTRRRQHLPLRPRSAGGSHLSPATPSSSEQRKAPGAMTRQGPEKNLCSLDQPSPTMGCRLVLHHSPFCSVTPSGSSTATWASSSQMIQPS